MQFFLRQKSNMDFKKLKKIIVCTAILMMPACPSPKAEGSKEAAEGLPELLGSAPEVTLSTRAPGVPWVGEILEYEMRWGMMTVGNAELRVMKNPVLISSRPCYHIMSTASSSSFLDRFYKVRDKNSSWMDVMSLISVGYSKQIREGGFFRDEWVKFNYKNLTFAAQKTNKKGRTTRSQGKIPGPVQDILTSLYYIRTKHLEVGKDIIMDVNTQKNWPMVIKVHKRQTVKTPAGKFDCFVVEPKLRDEGIFVSKGKRLLVWLTADPAHIPVMMKVEILLGQVSAKLVSRRYDK